MSHTPYVPIYDYAAKDSLPSGNTNKVIRGSELTEEFKAISKDLIRADARGRLFASVTFSPDPTVDLWDDTENTDLGTMVSSFSVEKVEWITQGANGQPLWKYAKVTFTNTLPEVANPTPQPDDGNWTNGDINGRANVQVTAWATRTGDTAFVFPTVIDLETNFVVIGFYCPGYPDGVQPVVWPVAFSLAVFEDSVPE
jgi:hypothetical protein